MTLLYLFIIALIICVIANNYEGFASSPATTIQLSASSGYYPFWRYGFGYHYPYYRFRYPYELYYPASTSKSGDMGMYLQYWHYPRPSNVYKKEMLY